MNSSILEDVGLMFYIVSPSKTSFETLDEVPDYFLKSIPYLMLLILAEHSFFLLSKKKSYLRLNDTLSNIAVGSFFGIVSVYFRGGKLFLYAYIYEKWRIVTLPWNSLWTWWICFFAADFVYYVAHRASHEVNIFWAFHQVHHSSEDFNFSTSVRNSPFQYMITSVFYLPFALAIPPSTMLVHQYLNFLAQVWIHTKSVTSIGPLEYILNTASHHRVHHGKNRYCIDKNYGGVLIIWDRIFGTFQHEEEPVVYGLTHSISSFNLYHHLLGHFQHICKTFVTIEGWSNKWSVVFKGPGWSPGKPRLGNLEDIPEIEYPVKKYDPKLELWQIFYIALHLPLMAVLTFSLDTLYKELTTVGFSLFTFFYIFSHSSLLDFLDGKDCSKSEFLRLGTFLTLEKLYLINTSVFSPVMLIFFQFIHLLSALFWAKNMNIPNNFKINVYSFKKKFE